MGNAKTVVRSTKISEELNLRTAACPVLILLFPALSCLCPVLSCQRFTEPSDNQLSSVCPRLRYHRALCLLWQDDCLHRIIGDSNTKKPSRFTFMSWIVTYQEAFDGLNQCAISFCIRTSWTCNCFTMHCVEICECLWNHGFNAPLFMVSWVLWPFEQKSKWRNFSGVILTQFCHFSLLLFKLLFCKNHVKI